MVVLIDSQRHRQVLLCCHNLNFFLLGHLYWDRPLPVPHI